MFLLSLTPGRVARSQDTPVDPAAPNWRQIAGQCLRVVYPGDRAAIQPIVRAALANDCDLELLDAENVAFSYFTYDKRAHRAFKTRHGFPLCEPIEHEMSPFYALSLLREYPPHASSAD